MTHERNVLMWLAGKLYKIRWPRFAFWVSMVILYSTLGCGLLESPTAPDPTHPNEILIIEHTQCYADYFRLGEITVSFFEDERQVNCYPLKYDENGDPFQCLQAGGAWPFKRHASYYGPWVRGELADYLFSSQDLEWVAAHEVCHMLGTRDEDVAVKCAELAWSRAGCHEGGFQPVEISPRLMF